ncbi:ABC transporter permease [Pseudomonas sp. N040]|uniref:ABC transporter permease n=1 Tax=Pseudomonas sp. N040 TaxID=2785325 RepID=UPI0018A2BD66|nr:ABC transporter permease [Pseudomonas sp. N040]MBF7728995.1 ABC transporter permease [Pseudomonas sp. N040]MBW7012635.1 ABC transporter permease [Pseudomonas sp. N040]
MRKSGIINSLSLAWMLAKRDLLNRYAGSYAGVFWTIGVPLLYAIINVVVFSTLMSGRMGARYGDIPFALFYFLPFSLWSLFSEVVGRSTGILREYRYLVSKIAFPFWVLPLVPLASALLSQVIILLLAGGLMAYNGLTLGDMAAVYLLAWLACVLITLGIAYAVSALSVYIPDLTQIVPVVLNILFWLTPILYPATLVEEHGALWLRRLIMDCNPFYYLTEISRHAVFATAPVDWPALAVLLALGITLLVAGFALFRRLKSGFADVL